MQQQKSFFFFWDVIVVLLFVAYKKSATVDDLIEYFACTLLSPKNYSTNAACYIQFHALFTIHLA